VSGLPGILLMLANAERRAPVDIYGPAGLAEVVRGLRVVAPHLPFALRLHELAGGETFAAVGLQGRVLAVDHALPCLAYRFDRPRAPRFDPERARALGVPVELWKVLQRGAPVRWADRLIEPSAVLGPPRPGLAFAFVTDTRPTSALPDFLRGVDLLVCEGTYGDDADQPKAVEKKHLTFREAATLARAAGVGQLLLTHFSPALRNPEAYAENARAVFPNTLIGRDHLTLTLRFRDDAPDQA
jgi:ribonuclease Z